MNAKVLSASVTYAVKLYLETVDELGARVAYDTAVAVAGLTTATERAQMRNAIASVK
jgi:hypothetical protein